MKFIMPPKGYAKFIPSDTLIRAKGRKTVWVITDFPEGKDDTFFGLTSLHPVGRNRYKTTRTLDLEVFLRDWEFIQKSGMLTVKEEPKEIVREER